MRSWVAGFVVGGLVTGAALGSALPAGAKAAPKPVKATSAAALAAAMGHRGLTCDPFVDSDDSDDSGAPSVPGGPPDGDTAECGLDGVTGSFAVYDTPRELARSLAAMPLICRFAVAVLGPVEFTFVVGPNWSISFFRDEYDPAVGRALGGKVRDVDCTARG